MNQILSVEMPNKKTKKNKPSINSTIIFFSIILIAFAIVIVGIVIYVKNQKPSEENNTQEPNNTTTQPVEQGPQINIQVVNEAKLKIIVTHDKKISTVEYKWDDEDWIVDTVKDKNYAEIEVVVYLGTRSLTVKVTDEDGDVKETEPKEYTNNVGTILMEQVDDKVKLSIESKNTISYISYNWDNEGLKEIQVNDTKTEQMIDIPKGKHDLKVVAVDKDGQEKEYSDTFVGDTKPTLKVYRSNNDMTIEASDDEGLSKMSINLNGKDLDEIDIVGNEYSKTITLEDVESRMIGSTQFEKNENAIIISVKNVNGYEAKRWIKVKKE